MKVLRDKMLGFFVNNFFPGQFNIIFLKILCNEKYMQKWEIYYKK